MGKFWKIKRTFWKIIRTYEHLLQVLMAKHGKHIWRSLYIYNHLYMGTFPLLIQSWHFYLIFFGMVVFFHSLFFGKSWLSLKTNEASDRLIAHHLVGSEHCVDKSTTVGIGNQTLGLLPPSFPTNRLWGSIGCFEALLCPYFSYFSLLGWFPADSSLISDEIDPTCLQFQSRIVLRTSAHEIWCIFAHDFLLFGSFWKSESPDASVCISSSLVLSSKSASEALQPACTEPLGQSHWGMWWDVAHTLTQAVNITCQIVLLVCLQKKTWVQLQSFAVPIPKTLWLRSGDLQVRTIPVQSFVSNKNGTRLYNHAALPKI